MQGSEMEVLPAQDVMAWTTPHSAGLHHVVPANHCSRPPPTPPPATIIHPARTHLGVGAANNPGAVRDRLLGMEGTLLRQ